MRKHILPTLLLALIGLSLHAQTILGIDVYHGDSDGSYGAINWTQVHTTAGKKFAFAKATQGVTYTDPSFTTNEVSGTNAGVIMGAYHFADPETNTALAEANHFISVARSYIGAGHLPPTLDLEDPSSGPALSSAFTSAQLTAWVQTWMTTVYDSTGVQPIIYTSGNYAGYVNSSLNTYGLWIANPNGTTAPPTNLGVWTTWLFKQYSWTGSVTGIGNPQVDLDVFNGDTTAFNALTGNSTIPSPSCNNDFSCGPPSPLALSLNGTCVNTACSTVNATPPSVNIAFNGGSTCSTLYQSGRYDDDVWFTVTPTTTAPITINITPTSNLTNCDPVVGLYSGSCSSPTQVACADLHGVGVAETMSYTPTAGTTYLVRVFSYGIGSTYSGDFNICAYSTCTAPSQPLITGDTTICNSATAALSVSNPCNGCTYSWSGGGTGTTLSASTAGTYYVTVTNSCSSTAVSTGWHVSSTTIAMTANSNPVSPCSGQTFALSAGGATTYSWSGQGLITNSSSNVSASVSSGGSYTYTVTGYTGSCSASTTVNVSITQTPVIAITPTGPIALCSSGANSSTSLQANGATTYTWSPATGLSSTSVSNPTASNLSAPTTYTVTGTTNGCSATSSVTVNVTQTPIIAISPSGPVSLCSSGANSSTSLQANGATSYTWSPSTGLSSTSVSNPTASNLSAPTTYTVTGTTNGCSATSSVTVNVTQTPLISITPTGPISLCSSGANSSVSLQANGATTFSWSPSTGLSSTSVSNPTASNLSAPTTYTVTGTTNGCSATGSVTVNVTQTPVITVSPDTATICAGGTGTTLTVSGAAQSYNWSPSTGLSATNASSVTANPSSNTTYTVTASNSICSATASSTVVVANQPLGAVSPSSPNITCLSGSVTLTAAPTGSGYSWSGPTGNLSSNTASVSVSSPGQYTVTITDAAGCNTSVTASVTVTRSTAPIVHAGSDQTIHLGDSIPIGGSPTATGGSGNYTYTWSSIPVGFTSAIADPRVSPTSGTTYIVAVTDSSGCSGVDTIVVSILTPPVCDTTIHPVITANGCYLAAPFYQGGKYQWALQGLALSGDTLQFYAATGIGYYTCSVTLGTCGYESNSVFLSCTNGLDEQQSISDITIVPNPSSGSFVISFSTDRAEDFSIGIYDLTGRMVRSETFTKSRGHYNKLINMEAVAKGIYILQIHAGDMIENSKIELR